MIRSQDLFNIVRLFTLAIALILGFASPLLAYPTPVPSVTPTPPLGNYEPFGSIDSEPTQFCSEIVNSRCYDGNQCTEDFCSDYMWGYGGCNCRDGQGCVSVPLPAGTGCTRADGSSGQCTSGGNCSCTDASECGTNEACNAYQCDAGTCHVQIFSGSACTTSTGSRGTCSELGVCLGNFCTNDSDCGPILGNCMSFSCDYDSQSCVSRFSPNGVSCTGCGGGNGCYCNEGSCVPSL